MEKLISFNVKEQMVKLAGACFWYWNSFHLFLESSGVPRSFHQRYPKGAFSKYEVTCSSPRSRFEPAVRTPGRPVARHPQPRSRKPTLRREIPWILRGFQGRLSC